MKALVLALVMTVGVFTVWIYRLEVRLNAQREYLRTLYQYTQLSDSCIINQVEQQKAYLDMHLKDMGQ